MKLNRFFIPACLAFATMATAQPSIVFTRSFGGTWYDYSSDVKATPDGGMIAIGTTLSNDGDISWNYSNSGDAFVIKLDASGTVDWKRVYGGSSFDGGTTISPTSDGGYILGGYTQSNDFDAPASNNPAEGSNIWLVKMDAAGSVQWKKTLSGSDNEMLVGLYQLADGSYVLGAVSNANDGDFNANYGSDDCWIFKLDTAGDIQWKKNYGGSSYDLMTRLIPTSDGGYAFSAFTNSNDNDVSGLHSQFDIWMVKLDNAGTIQWQQCYGGSGYELFGNKGLMQTSTGDFLLSSNPGSIDGDAAFTDTTDTGGCWVIKISSTGTLLWEHQYGGHSYETPQAMTSDANGNYIIAASSFSDDLDVSGHHGTTSTKDYWVFCLDPNGTILWQRPVGGSEDEEATGIALLNNGDIALIGDTYSNNDGDIAGSGYHWGTEVIHPDNSPAFTVNTCDFFVSRISPPAANTGIGQVSEITAQLYPNPASEQFTVTAGDLEAIDVHDMAGRLVFHSETSGETAAISVAGWSNGTYVVTVQTRNGLAREKLVVTGH